MDEAARNGAPQILTPREVFIGSKRFLKYGISPQKLAEMRARENPSASKQTPIMKDGYEYVYNSQGKLVRLEHFDAQTMEEFILTPDAQLTDAQKQQLADSQALPIMADEDCPESTPEQLERFRRFGQERNKRRAALERKKQGFRKE